MPDRRLQFRALFRQFLFRTIDLEALSPDGDAGRLLGRFAALLTFIGLMLGLAVLGFGNARLPRHELLISAWPIEHTLIATTMLVVGLFAVLSWDTVFPDRRDVHVLGHLPIEAKIIFLAKVAATGASLSIAIVAVNALVGFALPLALGPKSRNMLDLLFSIERIRLFLAFWVTITLAGLFVFCGILSLQGAASLLLPRRTFLRFSALLQLGVFALLLGVYLRQPALANPMALADPANQRLLRWLPSYWFLGLLQDLIGFPHTATSSLTAQAGLAVAVAVSFSAAIYLANYSRLMRQIVEEPDIVPTPGRWRFTLPFRDSLDGAIVDFTARAILRSRQHRLLLAFYLGLSLVATVGLMRTPRGSQILQLSDAAAIFASLVFMSASIVGLRVVFSIPLDLRANWIFQLTQVRPPAQYFAAIRKPIFLLSLAPVSIVCGVYFLAAWPWQRASSHLLLLGVFGAMICWISLWGFRKIPFTCSWLPGRSAIHLGVLAALGFLTLLGRGAAFEIDALADTELYLRTVAVLGGALITARWLAQRKTTSTETFVEFEGFEPPVIQTLGLASRDRA